MKKYKFKLEVFLKMKKWKEKEIKQEMVEIISEIESCEEKIKKAEREISMSHNSEGEFLKKGTEFRMITFFANFSQAKRIEIENQKRTIKILEKKRKEINDRLVEKMNEVDVIEEMREKDYSNFLRTEELKMEEDLEDSYLMTKLLKESA